MGGRFLALAHSGRIATSHLEEQALADLLGLACRYDDATWMVLTDPDDHIVSLGRGGLLIGHLFGRTSNEETRDFPTLVEASSVVGRGGRNLLYNHWGSYLAFWRTPGGAAACLRDPAGGRSCYFAVKNTQLIVASGLDMFAAIDPELCNIEWLALRRHFLAGESPGPQTCIHSITELPPGALLEAAHETHTVEQIWTPVVAAATAEPKLTMPDACALVRRSVLSSVSAWGRTYTRALVELSGGLDSSIVAAALCKAGVEVTAITLVSPRRDGDERLLARSVADTLGITLHERERDVAQIDLGHAIAPHLPRPGVRGFTQETDRHVSALAGEIDADALFSGGGGDGVFCFLHSAAPFHDRVRAGASSASALRTALDVSDITGSSVWRTFSDAVRYSCGLRKPGRSRRRAELVGGPPDGHDRSVSALLEGASALPWGRREHVEEIAGSHGFLTGMGRSAHLPLLFPLMAQPVIEACLAIPSWLWVKDGHDRAVARHAFAPELPEQVAFRRSKGRLDSFGRLIFDMHRQTLRELLLEGRLASNGFLDRAVVEHALADRQPARTNAFFLLLELADIEAWVQGVEARSWSRH